MRSLAPRCLAALALSLLVIGCRSEPRATGATAAAGQTSGPPAFRNAQGALVCPVMGDEIASEQEARGHIDHGGTRYYFCCGSCVAAFKKDPEKYAQGRFLREQKARCEAGEPGIPEALCR